MESSSNILLIITFLMAGTFNVIFPLLLGWWIIKKRGTSWKLFGVGVLTFIGSQIFHIPAVSGLTRAFSTGLLPNVSISFAPYFNAIVLGLLAGIFEETARWIGYKILKKKADSFGAALTLGAGHGGIEAIIIGVSVLATLISMLALQSSDAALSALPSGQADLARQQVQAYWATAWHISAGVTYQPERDGLAGHLVPKTNLVLAGGVVSRCDRWVGGVSHVLWRTCLADRSRSASDILRDAVLDSADSQKDGPGTGGTACCLVRDWFWSQIELFYPSSALIVALIVNVKITNKIRT